MILLVLQRRFYGKTLGFLLPAVWKILNDKNIKDLNKPRILVVAPTRELAMQTNVVADEMPLKNVCIYGGVPKRINSVH